MIHLTILFCILSLSLTDIIYMVRKSCVYRIVCIPMLSRCMPCRIRLQNDYAALKQAFSTCFRGSQGGSGQYGISGFFPSVLEGDKSIYDCSIERQKVAYDNVRNDPAQRDIMAKTLYSRRNTKKTETGMV